MTGTPGSLTVVGLGPGGPTHRTRAAEAAVRAAQVVVGYRAYLAACADLIGDTPVGLVTDGGRDGEQVELSTLAAMDPGAAGMRTVVIIGASRTCRLGDWLLTARSLVTAAV